MSPPLETPALVMEEEQRMAQLFLDLVAQDGIAREAPWSYGHEGTAFDAATKAIQDLLVTSCGPDLSGESAVLGMIRAGFIGRLIKRLWKLRERKPRRSVVLSKFLRDVPGEAAISRAPAGRTAAGGGSRG
jgi:hypothetical protein